MTATTLRSHRSQRPEHDESTAASPRGPIARVVLASLATGLLGAALLSLLTFPGASEHVITGSAMVAFGLGWSLLAVLSSRLTSQPQRWALVPAAAMASTGSALLIFAPGETVLTVAGWVWPPALLALSTWMFVQLRRALLGRTRWLLYPVVALLAAAAVGGMYESVSLAGTDHQPAMPGQLYDVGGYRLHLNCIGTGSPTVVLQSGLSEMSSSWDQITDAVSTTSRVCAYDRAGQGWSDDAPHQKDGVEAAEDLHALLHAASERGPFVLVGHSIGGTYALTYAAMYPEQVAGMVLLDSSSPAQFTALPDFPLTYAITKRLYGVLPSLARLGLAELAPTSSSGLDADAAAQVQAFASSPRGLRNTRDEHAALPDAFMQAQALTTLNGKPLVVLTALQDQSSGWSAAQDRLAALSTNSSHPVVDAAHAGLLDDPDGFGASIEAIHDVVQAVRAGAPLTAS